MELTARYLRERFLALNDEYFGGELPLPYLRVSNSRTRMGSFSCTRYRKSIFSKGVFTNFKIAVSEYYKQTAEEIDDTLLHEMIHYLIAYRQLRDTSSHGTLFKKEMARLNAMGRHLTISVRTRHLETRQQNKRQQHLVLALEDRNGKRYLAVVHPSYRKYIEKQLHLATTITAHHWFVSNDDFFNDFPQARTLRARQVTTEKYDSLCHECLHELIQP